MHVNLEFSRTSFVMEVKAFLCLFWIVVQRVSSLRETVESSQDVAADADVDFQRLENEYAVGNSSAGTNAYENTTKPEIPTVSTAKPQTKSDNDTEFRPSWHLGAIEEFRSANSNPFNKLSHFKFDNSFTVQPERQVNWYTATPEANNETKSFNDLNQNNINNKINLAPLTPPVPNFFPSSIGNEDPYFRIQNSGAAFPHAPPPFKTENLIPTGFQNPLQIPPAFQRPEFPANSPEKTFFDATYVQEIPQPLNRPGSFHNEVNFVTPFNDVPNFDFARPPSFENYEEPNGVKFHSEIHEVSPTRSHRFPYKFHHEAPTFMDGNLEYVADEHVYQNPLREHRISPWKKIIHLIGTILPFGLLLATLTPSIVQISNSTQSSIPLSKLKEVNLPPEHKGLRMADDPSHCTEEKNICEVILAGGKPRSNLLQNVLWNFVMRTPEKTAKDNGLREMFQAVKKRDCNLITC